MKERMLDVIKWGLILIIAGTVFYMVHGKQNRYSFQTTPNIQLSNTEWIKLTKINDSIINLTRFADINLPKIKKLHGKAKFINMTNIEKPRIALGYLIDVEVEDLDLSKVPAEYLKKQEYEKTSNNNTFTYIRPSIQDCVIRSRFDFTLKNSDGFTLWSLEGKKHHVEFGKKHTFQNVINEAIPISIANQITNIEFETVLGRCPQRAKAIGGLTPLPLTDTDWDLFVDEQEKDPYDPLGIMTETEKNKERD